MEHQRPERFSSALDSPGVWAVSLVRVDKLCKTYTLGKQQVEALRDVSLTINAGEFLAIAGPSGSGKTTLLNLIGCIDTPSSGELVIGEESVAGRTPDQLADLRLRTMGFIFQTFNLLPVLSAAENVEYPLLQMTELSRPERKKRVDQYLEVVGLEKYRRHRPNELSGGQRQRVAIARALATHPKIILADEPTANLDHKTGGSILALMKDLNRTQGMTFIFSTHDPSVMDMADWVVEVNDGVLTEQGIFKTWDVREHLASLENAFNDLLSQAFTEMPKPEAEKKREEIRRRTTRAQRMPDDWADQTLMR
jgi:putative ABC transport system ATP-binding protein